ncbi:MAG TPA: type II secretion system F family protein [Gemmatimonadaceae bacterium]|nr:type II secretion system F family protein [Gemmatimonadaceae bacterium]
MTIALLFLIALGVTSMAVAAYTFVIDRRRQALVQRALGVTDAEASRRSAILGAAKKKQRGASVLRQLPAGLENSKFTQKLVYAGYDGPLAPAIFAAARLATLVLIPTAVGLPLVRAPLPLLLVLIPGAALIAWILPIAILERMVRARQDRIRQGLPDALDLLVVCVEAGISLDAAILRVAKELSITYADLSRELLVVNRKTNAGVSREEAIRGLWSRTGVDDLRSLSTSLIQTEKWGTSITKVLRVSAMTLRRKRRQRAEKRVALAPVKMTFPLVTMILPALFIIILGPAVLQVITSLSAAAR